MEHLTFDFEQPTRDAAPARDAIVVGVVSSGNLEVMIEPSPDAGRCRIEVHTTARGFDAVWRAVLADFVERARPGGLRVSIHDVGATPAVVGLRLDQAVEAWRAGA